MKNLIVIGVGDFAREVYFHAQNSIGYGTEFIFKGYLDGNTKLAPEEYVKLAAPLLGDVETYSVQPDDVFVIAIANSGAKKILAKIMDAKGAQWYTLIHKTALVANNAVIGKDVILCPYVMVSVNVIIGDHVMFNALTTIGHDVVIGDYTSTMSHVDITGCCKVGNGTYWGSGSRALPHAKIGDSARIGAGSVVLNFVRSNTKVFGVPAKKYEM